MSFVFSYLDVTSSSAIGQESEEDALSLIQCSGMEAQLIDCPSHLVQGCSSAQVAGIRCEGKPLQTNPQVPHYT